LSYTSHFLGEAVMSAKRFALPIILSTLLNGCGTYVPEIAEFPGNAVDSDALVVAILINVKCEVRDAVAHFYTTAGRGPTYLDHWGIDTLLNLQISEKSSLSPSADLMPSSPASAVLTVGLGVNGSAEATRTNSVESFSTVAEFKAAGRCVAAQRGGPWLLQNDLKLYDWLVSALLGRDTNSANFSTFTSKDKVLTHEVKFEIASGGDFTPTWKLINATVNPSGTFLSASRKRVHTLTISLGPTDIVVSGPKKGTPGPSRAMSDAALASRIGAAVANSVSGTLRQ
jgi:hypothetical protein